MGGVLGEGHFHALAVDFVAEVRNRGRPFLAAHRVHAGELQYNGAVFVGHFAGQHLGSVQQTVPARNINHIRADFRQRNGLARKKQAVFCVSVFSVKKYFSYHTALAFLALILASSSSMPGASKPITCPLSMMTFIFANIGKYCSSSITILPESPPPLVLAAP